jgi:hypothetical protein
MGIFSGISDKFRTRTKTGRTFKLPGGRRIGSYRTPPKEGRTIRIWRKKR